MPCTEGCGACCDPVTIPEWAVLRAAAPVGPNSPQMEWIFDNLQPLDHQGEQVRLKCINYDVENRSCLAYDTRPPVCRDYPFYGKEPDRTVSPGGRLVCGYQAELGRTVLPIVEVR